MHAVNVFKNSTASNHPPALIREKSRLPNTILHAISMLTQLRRREMILGGVLTGWRVGLWPNVRTEAPLGEGVRGEIIAREALVKKNCSLDGALHVLGMLYFDNGSLDV
jgi:hypothetical protein